MNWTTDWTLELLLWIESKRALITTCNTVLTLRIHMCMCEPVSMYVCVSQCMYVCMHMHVCVYTYECDSVCTYTCMYKNVCLCVHVCVHVCVHAQTYVHTCIPASYGSYSFFRCLPSWSWFNALDCSRLIPLQLHWLTHTSCIEHTGTAHHYSLV